MTDAGVEVALPSIEPDVAAPLLNRGNGAGNEGEMPSHSTVEFNDGLTLRVRMSSNGHTFSVLTRQSSSVKSLKEDIMRIIDGKGKDIRLIASGKILKPESALIEEFKLADQSFLHCVVNIIARPRTESYNIQLMEEGGSGINDEANAGASTDPTQWRGFDRLRTLMSSEQIATILQMISSTGETGNADEEEGGVSDWDRQVEAEERWMATQGENSEFAINTSIMRTENTLQRLSVHNLELEDFQDTSAYPESKWDFLIGLLLGYLLHSVLAFFFLLAVNFSRPRLKAGILFGIALNAVFQQLTYVPKEE